MRCRRGWTLVSSTSAARGPRVPPHDLEAEESLLGAMLLSTDAVAAAVEICGSDDFYKPAHGHIFAAMVALFGRGEPVDAVTVSDELRRADLLESMGDPALLISLQANTPSVANALHYANIVEEHALLRRLVGAAAEIAEEAYSAPADVRGTLDWAEAQICNVAQRRSADQTQSWEQWMVGSLAELAQMEPHQVQGLRTGFHDLDDLLGGLQASNLVVVGARPAMGKTSLALGISHHVAAVEKRPVLLFSLEMSAREIMFRLVGSEAHVDASRLRAGYGSVADWDRIDEALTKLGTPPFFVNDNPATTVLDIRAQARRLQSRVGLGLVVVDYLQLMSSPKGQRADNRVVEVSQISRGLKILARELNVPVIALSQLSRSLEQRDNKRPMLSDLRESGSIEQDADVVMFLYREDAYRPETPTGHAELIVAKHRNGPTSTIRLSFLAREAAFRSAARDARRP